MTPKQTIVRAFRVLQAEGYSLASFVAPLELRRIEFSAQKKQEDWLTPLNLPSPKDQGPPRDPSWG